MTTMTPAKVVRTTCSGCAEDVVLDLAEGVASVAPRKGLVHFRDVYWSQGWEDLLPMWDCPVCEYADSYDLTQDEDYEETA